MSSHSKKSDDDHDNEDATDFAPLWWRFPNNNNADCSSSSITCSCQQPAFSSSSTPWMQSAPRPAKLQSRNNVIVNMPFSTPFASQNLIHQSGLVAMNDITTIYERNNVALAVDEEDVDLTEIIAPEKQYKQQSNTDVLSIIIVDLTNVHDCTAILSDLACDHCIIAIGNTQTPEKLYPTNAIGLICPDDGYIDTFVALIVGQLSVVLHQFALHCGQTNTAVIRVYSKSIRIQKLPTILPKMLINVTSASELTDNKSINSINPQKVYKLPSVYKHIVAAQLAAWKRKTKTE